jgi:hypothetical protein
MLLKIARRIVRKVRGWKAYYNLYRRLSPLSVDTIIALRSRALDYAEKLRIKGAPYGRYRYVEGDGPPLLYASVFATLLRHLLGDLDRLTSEERVQWIEYINSYQCEDGLFRDPLVSNEIAETEDWWGWRHLTLLVLMALHALSGQPIRPLAFLEKVDTPSKVRLWLDTLDWQTRVSFTSNTVQNYGAAMQYARDFMGETHLKDAIKELLAGLTERCDSMTGLWGNGFGDRRVALSEGVQTGYHFWLLYWYDGLDIPFPKRAFESILQLQNGLGGFALTHLNTTACQDIDGVDPLIRLALKYPELRDRAYKPIHQALRWILYNFNADGGACFQRQAPFIYGHELMASQSDQSSIFATWFRMLSVGVSCEFLKTIKPELNQMRWLFVDAPGYQFMRANERLTTSMHEETSLAPH